MGSIPSPRAAIDGWVCVFGVFATRCRGKRAPVCARRRCSRLFLRMGLLQSNAAARVWSCARLRGQNRVWARP
eukprot:7090700-Lingulodinium_polyedra.AAC.1